MRLQADLSRHPLQLENELLTKKVSFPGTEIQFLYKLTRYNMHLSRIKFQTFLVSE